MICSASAMHTEQSKHGRWLSAICAEDRAIEEWMFLSITSCLISSLRDMDLFQGGSSYSDIFLSMSNTQPGFMIPFSLIKQLKNI